MKNIFFILLILFVSLSCFSVSIAGNVSESNSYNSLISENIDKPENEHNEINHNNEHSLPNIFMVIPFVLLLLMIATGPLFYHHFWEKNYPIISLLLGAISVLYYVFILNDVHSVQHAAAEYISFIALLASLFTASGGILIRVNRKSSASLNVALLFIGAIISNLIGTTGASMLLIRPFISINQHRIKAFHIIFFIFIVSNIGGALTPIGDPPLFLGFLRGVDFFWTITNVWYIWLPTVLVLLAIFYFLDNKDAKDNPDPKEEHLGNIEFKGFINIIYLAIIIISVFLDPAVLSWVPSLAPLPFGIREIVMFSVVYLSYKTSSKEIHSANEFEWEPIKEVAFLFIGIFATMIPALQLIAHEAKLLGESLTPSSFYWATGFLSGFLDNAPTYLNFLSAEMGKFNQNVNDVLSVREFQNLHGIYLQAISVAAVFFGSMTYIGNGPNFMVKSICERRGIKMPSFFGYLVKYSIPILLPIFTIVWFVYFYGKS